MCPRDVYKRQELKSQGYLKYYKQRDKRQKPADFLRFTSTDGFEILVGDVYKRQGLICRDTVKGEDGKFTQVEGSETFYPHTGVIVSVSQGSESNLVKTTTGIETNQKGCLLYTSRRAWYTLFSAVLVWCWFCCFYRRSRCSACCSGSASCCRIILAAPCW